MRKVSLTLFILIFAFSCSNDVGKVSRSIDSTAEDSKLSFNNERIISNEVIEERKMMSDTVLENYVMELGLNKTYTIAIGEHNPYILTGYFNEDLVIDTAIFLYHKLNHKEGLLIKHGQNSDLIILGAGEEILQQGFDDFRGMGIFEIVKKGEKVASNIDEETGEIVIKDIPDSLCVELKTDGIFVHQTESCGGGIIYWNNKKYNWIQQE